MANKVGCLKCDPKWRNWLQNFLNQISGPPRRNPMIVYSSINRITKAVCTCATYPAWQNIGRDKINKAHEVYKQSSIFQSSDGCASVHKLFYDRLFNANLFQNPDRITSADRLVYILYCEILRQTDVPQNDIMQNICPRRERPTVSMVHLGSLRESHRGRFLGRSGTGIREAVHGIPVSNITIAFGESNGDTVTANATFNCRRRHVGLVQNGLQTRLGYYQTVEPIPLRERGNRGRVRHTPGSHQGDHGDSDTMSSLTTSGYGTLIYNREQVNQPEAMDTYPPVEDQQ